MPKRAWLTPASRPASYSWRAVLVPNDVIMPRADYEAIMRGALLLTTYAENYEQTLGLPVDDIIPVFDRVFDSFSRGLPVLPTGTIQAYAGGPLAPVGWLKCEGQEVEQATYPELFDVIGGIYGTATSGWFRLPDLRGRMIIGEGQGTGLTERELTDKGGAETHDLSVDEIPSHAHYLSSHAHFLFMAQLGVGDPVAGPDFPDVVQTDGIGGGQAHNNMPPFLVLNFIIFTGNFQ